MAWLRTIADSSPFALWLPYAFAVEYTNVMRRFVLLLALLIPGLVFAAPTTFSSTNYGIQSIIFGGTGLLHSAADSVPPQIIAGPVVSAITTTGATVTWATDKDGTSVVKLGGSSGDYTLEFGESDQATFTEHTVQLTNLTRGTPYYFIVRSVDVNGNAAESGEQKFTSDPGDITAPVVTQGPSIAVNSATSITVSWTTDKISSSLVQYGEQSVSENEIGQSEELTLFHQVRLNNLLSSQSYVLRILSKDADGNLYTGPIQTLTMPSSPAITNVQISDITLNSALIEWSTSSTATTVLKYGTVTRTYTQQSTDPTETQNHLVRLSALTSGTTYYLQLSGVDGSGNQLVSDEYEFKTVILPQITSFSVSAVTADGAQLNWTSSSDIDELIRYTITQNADPSLAGKQLTAGDDKLSSVHSFTLQDLESSSTYTVSVVGKDVFGNQAESNELVFKTPVDHTPPQILNVKTDTTENLGSTQSVEVLVSYGLSKNGTSVIDYGEGASGPYDKQVTLDTTLSMNKFLVIPDLVPGNSYHFHIVAKDSVGNTATSPDYLVLAPAQPISLADLIFGQISQNFGWLGKL
jgi:hypothetical protein